MKTRLLPLLFLALAVLVAGCSSDKGTSNVPGGGNTREFVSGDLGTGASYSHTFNTAKVVRYYCKYHGGPGGQGMSGVITVTAGGTAAQFESSITASTLQSLTVPVGSTIRWTNNHVLTHTVESDN